MSAEVTWLLPVKDAMPFLPATLASIAAQTFTAHRVLAWDNGSTDGSIDELRHWIGPGRPLAGEVVLGQPLGLGASLAAMVERADTELLARIDGDDINHRDRLGRQVAFMLHHPRIAVLGCGAEEVDERGQVTRRIEPRVTDNAEVRWALRFRNPILHPGVMLRRSAVLAVGNYLDLCPGQDFNLWARLAERHAMAILPEPLLSYRRHGRGISAQDPAGRAALDQAGRERVAAILYPGLSPDGYERLYHLVRDYRRLDVRLADVLNLLRLARRAAIAAGQHPTWFTGTRLFQQQWRNLMTRWLKGRPGIAAAWPSLKRLRHFTSPSASRPGVTTQVAGGSCR